MDLIFLLNISDDWDSLISFGKICHNFLTNKSACSCLIEDLVSHAKLYLSIKRQVSVCQLQAKCNVLIRMALN